MAKRPEILTAETVAIERLTLGKKRSRSTKRDICENDVLVLCRKDGEIISREIYEHFIVQTRADREVREILQYDYTESSDNREVK